MDPADVLAVEPAPASSEDQKMLDVRTVPMSFSIEMEQAADAGTQAEPASGADANPTSGADPGTEGSKAYLSGVHFRWVNGDKVGLFDNMRPDKHVFTLSGVSSDGATASLKGEVTEGSASWYAVFFFSDSLIFIDFF